MSTSSVNPSAAAVGVPAPDSPATGKTRSVHRCDYRVAGQLPNEDVRALTTLHEKLATNLAACFDAGFGTGFEIKFEALSQLSAKDHVAKLSPLCYVVPFSSAIVFAEFDLDLVFPVIDLLLGGTGSGRDADRPLSEIEEEIMQDVVSLVMRQAEAVWAVPRLAFQLGPRISPASMLQSLRPTEKVTALRFTAGFGNASGAFHLVLSPSFLDLLVRQLKADREQQKARTLSFPAPPLRERILDCDFEVAAELDSLRVPVKDLVALVPGSVLKLRVPVRTPASLTLGERALFEAVPVRSGTQRAAQLGRRSQSKDWKRR